MLYLLKLGGSLITDKTRPYTPRISVIDKVSREIREGLSDTYRLIIGHGGGSFPHTSASKYRTHLGFISDDSRRGMAIVHLDALKLNIIVLERFLNAGLNVYPIHSSSISIAEDSEIKYMFLETIERLLDLDIIPVIYGDVGIDLRKGCCILSTEELFRHITLYFRSKYSIKIIMCEEVDGVYTGDPSKDPNARLIEVIDHSNIDEVLSYLSGSRGVDVTGGMRHKVEKLYQLAELGIESYIINCREGYRLRKLLKGERIKGTIIKY